jgi:hypothetical protein
MELLTGEMASLSLPQWELLGLKLKELTDLTLPFVEMEKCSCSILKVPSCTELVFKPTLPLNPSLLMMLREWEPNGKSTWKVNHTNMSPVERTDKPGSSLRISPSTDAIPKML